MNTCNKENNYLTYEKVIDMAMLANSDDGVYLTPEKLDDRKFSYDDLMHISPEKSQELFKDIVKLHPDYSGIVLKFANLVDTNEKYVIIDVLLTIVNSLFRHRKKSDIIDKETKCGLLNNTLEILQSIKSNNTVTKSLIEDHKENSSDLMLMFLSKYTLCNYLLENKEFMKQAKVYNEVLNLFPQIKNNGR